VDRQLRAMYTKWFCARNDDLMRMLMLLEACVLTVKFRQPSHEFTFGVGMTSISYPLVLTPLV
jgi:hypothetical protein